MIGRQSFHADEAPAEMALLADGLENHSLQPAIVQCADVMKQAVRDNFTSSAGPDGDAWLPRKRSGDGHPLLMDTGALLQAATGGGNGHIEIIQDREVAMGVSGSVIPYASTQNFGRGNIPAREYEGMSDDKEQDCEEIIGDFVMAEVFG